MDERTQGDPADSSTAPPVSDVQWALRELQIAMDQGAAALARRAGMPPNDMAGLDVVTSAPSERNVGPVDIARRLGITTASATGMVDRLVDSGHLERHPHPTDRRRVQLRHTPRAEAVMWQALEPLLAGVATVEERLTPEERTVVARFLRDIAGVWRTLDVV